ncbi:MAG TPA: diguanylate cyclase [Nitrospirae bacterium]|nr:diguanylate cyclase [Nitrospirota bacterium]HDO26344.1 diguanylate cyclase [Nitrospirota bacterium]
MQKNVDIFNKTEKRPYKLSISFGIKKCDPRSPYSLDEILDEADKLMYEQKRQKRDHS